VLPDLAYRTEGGAALPVLVWRFASPLLAVSSAPLGGGIGPRQWVLNTTVPAGYVRNDPDVHLAELAAALGLDGAGVGLMTAVDVAGRVTAADGGVEVVATVGLGHPTLAAAPDQPAGTAGTINVVAFVPVRMADAALVNAVATVAEAKSQALMMGRAMPATGTASDATCVVCPATGPAEPYGGPRSTWGARLARAVHAAVLARGATLQ
jgi:adenosylcobinamide hydrolase